MSFDYKEIEKKWQKLWSEGNVYRTSMDTKKPKYYVLDMFPYPSGAGLHVGHPLGYIGSDIIARYKRMNDHNVLHPMGWDAFGLPAENYAIKTGTHPRETTMANIKTFRRQLDSFGFSYDWERELSTVDPEYYKWTQWIFVQLFKKGLAYEAELPINWCPKDKTGLANEEVVDGCCERCGTPVERKDLRQWVLRITKYADRLLTGLSSVDWPEKTRLAQEHWIGRNVGAEIIFDVDDSEQKITVFTTRIDTIFGCTYVVIAPEHPLVEKIVTKEQKKAVEKYLAAAKKKSDMERTELNLDKTGVFTGSFARNPFTNEYVPIWVADYVLGHYGTGAVMAVPAHDERDFEFAKKYDLKIKVVIEPITGEVKQDEEKRKSIVAIVENPKDGKVLSINWGPKLGGNLFIGGGLKDGEDPLETAKREIKEETGYKNVELVTISEKIHHHYFAFSKNVARQIEAVGFHFKLLSEEREEQELEDDEKGKFHVEWLSKEDTNKRVADPLHKYLFDKFIQGKIYTDDGILGDSGKYSGMESAQARKEMIKWLEDNDVGQGKVNYKMHDWIFSRQRYWGEPIPIVHCQKCGPVAVPEEELPLLLPEVEKYEPTGTGESPLAAIEDWVNTTCPNCDGPAKRETNTMPQWAGSCWYFLRFIDPRNDKALADKKMLKQWMPVDMYIGGSEHAVLHLLYARFWNMFLYDIGAVPVEEPFKVLKHQGLILGENNQKMSKSRGNVVNPDEVISEYGADTFRLYEMFMGPFTDMKPWSTKSIEGVHRFLQKVWRLSEKDLSGELDNQLTTLQHKTIKKVGEDIHNLSFNTAISQMMIYVNALSEKEKLHKAYVETLLILLCPFAPHITEEIWEKMGNKPYLVQHAWPKFEEKYLVEDVIEIPVQVNGKVRDVIKVQKDMAEKDVIQLAKESAAVQKWLSEGKLVKEIFVPGKMVNFVVK